MSSQTWAPKLPKLPRFARRSQLGLLARWSLLGVQLCQHAAAFTGSKLVTFLVRSCPFKDEAAFAFRDSSLFILGFKNPSPLAGKDPSDGAFFRYFWDSSFDSRRNDVLPESVKQLRTVTARKVSMRATAVSTRCSMKHPTSLKHLGFV